MAMTGTCLGAHYRVNTGTQFSTVLRVLPSFNTSLTPVIHQYIPYLVPVYTLSYTCPPPCRIYHSTASTGHTPYPWPYLVLYLALAIPSIILSLGHTWYIYLALAIPGYIYLALAIPGYIQLSMAIPGYIQLSMAVPGYIPTWPYPGIYQHGRTRVYTYPDIPVRLVYDSPLF